MEENPRLVIENRYFSISKMSIFTPNPQVFAYLQQIAAVIKTRAKIDSNSIVIKIICP
jgi:hypothetical protein